MARVSGDQVTYRLPRARTLASGYVAGHEEADPAADPHRTRSRRGQEAARDRKSTRLNSSHSQISYAVFCLKKKRPRTARTRRTRGPARSGRGGSRGAMDKW